MTIPRWMLPLLAVVAAIAVGVAATLIGMRFLPEDVVQATPQIVTAPILEPLGELTEEEEDNLDFDKDWGISDQGGSREVVLPGTGVPSDYPGFDEAVERVGAAYDPAAEIRAMEAESAEPTAGDPCAPVGGAVPEGCPTGLMGTILPLVSPPAFQLAGQAFPPTLEQFDARGNPAGRIWCATPDTTEGAVPVGVVTTVPTTSLTLLVWAGDDHRRIDLVNPDATAWHAAFAAAGTPDELPALQACTIVSDLRAGTVYSAMVLATSDAGATRISSVFRFNATGEPIRPPATFTTLGQNWVIASALHTAGQRVEVKAWVLEEDSVVECPPQTALPFAPVTVHRSAVTEDDLLAQNAPADYDSRQTTWFRVPEGATMLFCARWYPAADDSPSWERQVPLFESSTVLSAPDRILPVLKSNGGYFNNRGAIAAIEVVAATSSGVECGRTDAFVDASLPRTRTVLCDTDVLAGASARSDDNRSFWNQPWDGDIALTMNLTRTDGAVETTSFVVPSSRYGCFGVCELPRTRAFAMPIGTPDYDCGDSGNPFRFNRTICSAIAGTEEGSLQLELSFAQGLSNGVTGDWQRGPVTDAAVEWEQLDYPQMNTDQSMQLGDIDPVTFTGSGSLLLQVDRPVSYSVFLNNADGTGACQLFPPFTNVQAGTVTDEIELTWSHLCVGQIYSASVSLTDETTGVTSIFTSTYAPPGARWGTHALLVVPGLRVEDLHYSWSVADTDDDFVDWYHAELSYGRRTLGTFDNSSTDFCSFATDPFRGEGTTSQRLASETRFTFYVESVVVRTPREGCFAEDVLPTFYSVPVNLYTLMSTGEQTLSIADPDTGQVVTMRFWVDE